MLTKYIDPLPIPSVMPPQGGTLYHIGAYQKWQQLHSQLPPTTVWAYGADFASAGYPAMTIEAVRGVPIRVRWTNNLVGPLGNWPHPLPVDPTLHWANPFGFMPPPPPIPPDFTYQLTTVPLVPHLHGGEVEPQSDGGPEAWFTPGWAITGPDWTQKNYEYINEQPATTLWYHDHALGITRLNVTMGLAGFYLLRDPWNEPVGLPGPAPALGDPPGMSYYEIPVVIQDRQFDTNGQFLYPTESDNPDIHPFWIPEFFGDTILVNGKVWPYLNVEARRYRFRLLNGSNARFYSMRLIRPGGKIPGPSIWQIGTDGGYLPAPVEIASPDRLTMAPGERADVIIDFTGIVPGTQLLLVNDARSPYPDGDDVSSDTTAQIMLFNVVPPTGPDFSLPPAQLVLNQNIPNLLNNPIAQVRTLTLNEVMGPGGPLMAVLDGKKWDGAVTETPALGTTEIWQLVNLTGDAHPIHTHLSQFQPVGRQRFRVNQYLAAYNTANPIIPVPEGMPYYPVPVEPYLQGPLMPPPANEQGWKDTIQAFPGEVTFFVVRWSQIADGSPYGFDATAFPGYVWHCHILEHEDNEMMRRLQPIP